MLSVPIFYRVRLDPLPEHLYAITNRKENFQWIYTPIDKDIRCEINFLQEGSLSEMRPDGEHTYPQGSVLTLVHDHVGHQYSKDPILHEFVLIFNVAQPPEPVSAEFAAHWDAVPNGALLPETVTNYAACQQVGNLIKSVIGVNNSDLVARGLRLRTALYKCLAVVTESAVQQARQLLAENPTSNSTVLACEYIREHLAEKLNVREIAGAIGANYNYLKILFRRDMNMSMVDYINSTRIQRVEQLITVEGLSLTEAGKAVGICDADYLSRLFHRYKGITAREYRMVYNERRHKGFSPNGVILSE